VRACVRVRVRVRVRVSVCLSGWACANPQVSDFAQVIMVIEVADKPDSISSTYVRMRLYM